jgi:hypothetical protein
MQNVAQTSLPDRYIALCKHISEFFKGHRIAEHRWTQGPITWALPDFRVFSVAPKFGIGNWVYISAGASVVNHGSDESLEFMLVAPKRHDRFVELLARTAIYNIDEPLDLGHTFPIGEPWFKNSLCDYFLVSLPHLHGPDLMTCCLVDEHIHIYWLLPITKAENDYSYEHSLEALEKLFEQKKLEYWRPDRQSLV